MSNSLSLASNSFGVFRHPSAHGQLALCEAATAEQGGPKTRLMQISSVLLIFHSKRLNIVAKMF
jgi:hypothetical protein